MNIPAQITRISYFNTSKIFIDEKNASRPFHPVNLGVLRLRVVNAGTTSISHLYSGDPGPECLSYINTFPALLPRRYTGTVVHAGTGGLPDVYSHIHSSVYINAASAHPTSPGWKYQRAPTIHIFAYKLHHVCRAEFQCAYHGRG